MGDLVDHSLDLVANVATLAMILTSMLCGRENKVLAFQLCFFYFFNMYLFHWNCKLRNKVAFQKVDITEMQVSTRLFEYMIGRSIVLGLIFT